MKLFYSWQSDTPQKTGRYFIKEAIELAINELHSELSFTEAERPTLDHDTKGIPGAPPIADTIFKKIDECDVFLVDVTIVGTVPSAGNEKQKALINSNVAIELGYALKSRGDEALLMVLNSEHGLAKALPFDLRHRRWPIEYSLSETASKEEKNQTKKSLVKKIKPALRFYIEQKSRNRATDLHNKAETTISPAHYFRGEESLVHGDINRGWPNLKYKSKTLMYMRVYPKTPIELLPESAVQEAVWESQVGPMREGLGEGTSPSRNRFGGIVYSMSIQEGLLLSSTQLFRTGEIWGIDSDTLNHRVEHRGHTFRIIPSQRFEQVLASALNRYVNFARRKLSYTLPVIVEAGSAFATGLRMTTGPSNYSDLVHRDHIRKQCELTSWDQEEVDRTLLDIFGEFFDAVGLERPDHLNGFPPRA